MHAVLAELSPMDLMETYQANRDDLTRFATILVGRDDALDVVSNAMVRLLEQEPHGIANPRAYLFSAVANQAKNFKRTEARRRRREERVPEPTPAVPDELYPDVRQAINNLSVRQRAVVYLFYWEDLAEADIATHLGISSGSVRRHLARARQHLRRVLHAYQ